MNQPMISKIKNLENDDLVKAIYEINKPWGAYTVEERLVRAALLKEFENRSSGERLDGLLDKLDAALAS